MSSGSLSYVPAPQPGHEGTPQVPGGVWGLLGQAGHTGASQSCASRVGKGVPNIVLDAPQIFFCYLGVWGTCFELLHAEYQCAEEENWAPVFPALLSALTLLFKQL